jgi:secreted Zn-dependent insulinase-like peptidase
MSEEDFLQHRTALVTRKSEKPKRLWDRGHLLWEEITSRQLKFNRAQVEIKELETVTRDELLGYFAVRNTNISSICLIDSAGNLNAHSLFIL